MGGGQRSSGEEKTAGGSSRGSLGRLPAPLQRDVAAFTSLEELAHLMATSRQVRAALAQPALFPERCPLVTHQGAWCPRILAVPVRPWAEAAYCQAYCEQNVERWNATHVEDPDLIEKFGAAVHAHDQDLAWRYLRLLKILLPEDEEEEDALEVALDWPGWTRTQVLRLLGKSAVAAWHDLLLPTLARSDTPARDELIAKWKALVPLTPAELNQLTYETLRRAKTDYIYGANGATSLARLQELTYAFPQRLRPDAAAARHELLKRLGNDLPNGLALATFMNGRGDYMAETVVPFMRAALVLLPQNEIAKVFESSNGGRDLWDEIRDWGGDIELAEQKEGEQPKGH